MNENSITKSILLVIALFLFCPIVSPAQDFEQKQIKISPGSVINIYGDAGVADFTCEFDIDHLQSTGRVYYNSSNSKIFFKNSDLVLKNRGFDCGKKSRNKDFHEMVRTDEYPEMKLTLKEVTLKNEEKVLANVDILIAGKENNYNIEVDVSQKKPMQIKGQFKINVLDFGLEPITKMFGLIKVDEMIDINFDLIITE